MAGARRGGERLIGVTDWCTEPAAALDGLARVRGTKNPDLEAIRGLELDLVVANAEENRKLDVQRLEAGGLAVFVTMPTTVAGAVAELRHLAAAVGDLDGAAAWTPSWSPPSPTPTAAGPPAGPATPDWPLTCRNAPAQAHWVAECMFDKPAGDWYNYAREEPGERRRPTRAEPSHSLWL